MELDAVARIFPNRLLMRMMFRRFTFLVIFNMAIRARSGTPWDGGISRQECGMCSKSGWRLDSPDAQIVEVKSLPRCLSLCLVHLNCSCVNYTPAEFSCELLSKALCDAGLLVPDSSAAFYSRSLCDKEHEQSK